MKILQIHTKLVSGGIEAIVCGLANEMVKEHNVTVCTIFQPKEDDVFYARLSPEVKKITIGKREFGFSLKEIFNISKLIGSGKYDVVHIHGCFQYYALAALLHHSKTKIFYTIHSDAKMENQTWDQRLFRFKRFCFKHRWIRPVTISPNSQQSFTDLYGCESALVRNGITSPVFNKSLGVIEQYRKTPDTLMFIHPGRVSEAKNQVVLCQAFDQLIKDGHDIVLLIAGMAEDKRIFAHLEPYFQERLVYLGERRDVPQLMSECDAFCLPSIWEGLPVTLLEALSVGCIPICSPVGGIVNVVEDGVSGLLSKSSSLEDYISAIQRFIYMNEQDREIMKKHCLSTFKEYTIETTASNYINEYKK